MPALHSSIHRRRWRFLGGSSVVADRAGDASPRACHRGRTHLLILERFVRYTPFEIAESGHVGDTYWHQLQAYDAADSWVAFDGPGLEFAFLRYHEELAVLFVTVGGLDQPTAWWRFDVVSQRPPQVTYVGHRGLDERDPTAGKRDPAIPEAIHVLFDVLELEIV